jgi:hypothetical protein
MNLRKPEFAKRAKLKLPLFARLRPMLPLNSVAVKSQFPDGANQMLLNKPRSPSKRRLCPLKNLPLLNVLNITL